MPEIPFGFSFDQNDEGFVLRSKQADGTVTSIAMSAEDLAGFRTTVALWLDRRMSSALAASGSVRPIAVHRIAQVQVFPDALQQNVLLTVMAPSGEHMTLELPPLVAQHLADAIPALLAQMSAAKPPRQ